MCSWYQKFESPENIGVDSELENYIRELEECIEKKINYTSPLPMECIQPFSASTDSTLDSYPVPSTCMEQDSGPRNSALHYYPVPSTCMEQESDSTLDCYIVPSTTNGWAFRTYSDGNRTQYSHSRIFRRTQYSHGWPFNRWDYLEITELTSSDDIAQSVGMNLKDYSDEEEELSEFNSIDSV